MALTTKNWTVNSYINDTWTDLVAEPATIATVAISSVAASDVIIEVRLDDGVGASLHQILPPFAVSANEAFSLDLRSINVTGSQRIQIKANAVGAEFLASGVV